MYHYKDLFHQTQGYFAITTYRKNIFKIIHIIQIIMYKYTTKNQWSLVSKYIYFIKTRVVCVVIIECGQQSPKT